MLQNSQVFSGFQCTHFEKSMGFGGFQHMLQIKGFLAFPVHACSKIPNFFKVSSARLLKNPRFSVHTHMLQHPRFPVCVCSEIFPKVSRVSNAHMLQHPKLLVHTCSTMPNFQGFQCTYADKYYDHTHARHWKRGICGALG